MLMKGSIHKSGSTWYYILDIGRALNGKRKQHKKGGYKTKEDAEEALVKANDNIEQIREQKAHKLKHLTEFIPELKEKESISANDVFLNVSEDDVETLIVNNIELVEEGMKFLDKQVEITGGRIDILARDRKGKLCVIEVKIRSEDRELIYQCAYYPTQFKFPVRMIAICPEYDPRIYEGLKRVKDVEFKKFALDTDNQIHISDYTI
jgi:RecB family endonuclease NucS